jgi:hypothetical protein
VTHGTRDWLATLRLVAGGCGLTTIPGSMLLVVPDGVRALPVRGARETRRALTAQTPGRRPAAVRIVEDAIRVAAAA